MKEIILTGATGFIGKNLLLSLKNYTVVAFVRNKKKLLNFIEVNNLKNIKCVQIDDFLSDIFIDKISRYIKPSTMIVHLAWEATPGLYHNSVDNYHWFNQTINLGQKIKLLGCKKFIVAGTCAEYRPLNRPLKITDTIEPTTLYSLSKACAHKYLKSLFNDSSTQFIWIRLFYLFGRFEPAGRLASEVRKAISEQRSINLSSGTQIRDFLDVEVVTAKFLGILEKKSAGTYNICSGEAISVRDFIVKHLVCEKDRYLLKFGKKAVNEFDPPYVVGEPSKI